ncbi:MAG: hypothetical protein LC734_02790 [Acidobacteria bacterium]|nr:hypothetical protein [Acidobacteriota bacterium]
MSKTNSRFPLFAGLVILILQSSIHAVGQRIEAIVSIEPGVQARIEGRFSNAASKRNLSFLTAVAGAGDLGGRISDVSLGTVDGRQIKFRKLNNSEYLADEDFSLWSYGVDLSPPKTTAAAAHTSWLSGDGGALMLDDILPQTGKSRETNSGQIMLRIPDGWKIFTAEKRVGNNTFEIASVEKAVFIIGPIYRRRTLPAGRVNVDLVLSGEWHFTDDEAAQMASEILTEYQRSLGFELPSKAQITIAKFPGGASHGVWQAETRGSNVLILSGDMAFRTQSLQRLHEQLRHEIFHLWMPNTVNLRGNYDWFYEGFAQYQSLKLAVALNRIRFEDFLDTLSRAYSIDNGTTPRVSLIEASTGRWRGGGASVYARGILVAFLTDVLMLDASGGKRSAIDIVRLILHAKGTEQKDGNEVVIAAMLNHPELVPIVEKYVRGTDPIDRTHVEIAGISARGAGSRVHLNTMAKPNRRQKAMLNKLGYNNWRKLAGDSK